MTAAQHRREADRLRGNPLAKAQELARAHEIVAKLIERRRRSETIRRLLEQALASGQTP